jgi:flagellar assembly protein FliH
LGEKPLPDAEGATSVGQPVEALALRHEDHEALLQARLAHVEAEAATKIAEAQAEAERWRAHALATEAESSARGFAAGYADGLGQSRIDAEATVRAEQRAATETIATLAKRARLDTRTYLRAAQSALAALSVEIARVTIGEAFSLDNDLLQRRIAALLDQIADATTAVVRVAPADLNHLQPLWPAAMRARRAGERGPRLMGDPSLTPGDCIIESHTRYFDARLEPLFALVAETFAALPATPPEGEQPTTEEDWSHGAA